MFTKKLTKQSFILFIMISVLFVASCDLDLEEEAEETLNDALASLVDEYSSQLGWYGAEEEDVDNIESDINLGASSSGSGSLPSSVDLKQYFPPIGDQGKYGTCVAWAVGYNLRTFLNAKSYGWSSSELSSTSKQYSPKDLFFAIPSSAKGDNCGGTSFESALDVMVSRGVSTLSDVPYSDLGSCSGSASSWDSYAGNHKIENYRKIDHTSVSVIKDYLADGRAVAFGAKLGDNFMATENDAVLSSDTYEYSGQHAYHAMILSGYDDSRGANGAFRVVNSWGTSWGDAGHVWVDYNFFVNEFCFCAFVAKNTQSNPDDNGDNTVDDDELKNGYDLVSWNLEDIEDTETTSQTDRFIKYNVYNSGSNTIYASQDWNIVYLYYDAYDANNYGILIFDYYTDDFGSTGPSDHPNYDVLSSSDPNYVDGAINWWNNIDVPPSESVANVLVQAENFSFSYDVPTSLNGEYYFVLMADGYDVIKEDDETNNTLYFTEANGDPIPVNNGVVDDSNVKQYRLKSTPSKGAASPNPTAVSETNVNAYTPEEIQAMILHHKETGALQKKIDAFKQSRMPVSKSCK